MKSGLRAWVIKLAVMIALVETASGATLATASVTAAGFDRYYRTELYFGFGKKDGTEVTAEEWSRFLSDEVTLRFPDGLTMIEANGQFRSASGIIVREKSRVIILLYKKNERRSASKKIDDIRAAYCRKFDQESVLRVDLRQAVEVSFEE